MEKQQHKQKYCKVGFTYLERINVLVATSHPSSLDSKLDVVVMNSPSTTPPKKSLFNFAHSLEAFPSSFIFSQMFACYLLFFIREARC